MMQDGETTHLYLITVVVDNRWLMWLTKIHIRQRLTLHYASSSTNTQQWMWLETEPGLWYVSCSLKWEVKACKAMSIETLASTFPRYDSPDNGNESGPQWANRSAYIKHPLIYYRHKKSLSSVEIDSRRGQDEETPVWFLGSAYKGAMQQMISFFYH